MFRCIIPLSRPRDGEPRIFRVITAARPARPERGLRLGVTYEKGVTLGNVTMSHRQERPANHLASLSHSTMIGLPRVESSA
ncbi:hypothetical protein EVAR_97884_1 [Eumeta japonica]|uniref:Uncharacterized protein n=1 Tax=Eumeta variegata TaxID=151549 RepID=A0A4C1WHI6_EUMVA|nr:hypothetical protein EVAR_97884_1 [Eumeta japonica]